MSGAGFNLAVSILFVGYLLTMQRLSSLLITRLKPSVYLDVVMSVWSAVCMSIAAVQNLAGLFFVRLFSSRYHGSSFPGAAFLLLSRHTRSELSSWIAQLYSRVTIAIMFGNTMANNRAICHCYSSHGIKLASDCSRPFNVV